LKRNSEIERTRFSQLEEEALNMFSPQTLQKLGCTSARGSSATRFGEISPFWQNMAFL